MAIDSARKLTGLAQGRKIALFPGAFRPPHKAHYNAVLSLVARPDIDEVVVIIANRSRHIPGTKMVLTPEVALHVWAIYLWDVAKVRVEIAQNSAVEHAFGYFDQASEQDSLLFCVGEEDIKGRSELHKRVSSLAQRTGVMAEIVVADTRALPGRATQLRACLANGEVGRDKFMQGLPDQLTAEQRDFVWYTCQENMTPMCDLNQKKAWAIIEESGLGKIRRLSVAKPDKVDPVFRVHFAHGNSLYLKYANDTVSSASFDQPLGLKPRRRLSAERRAIKWLRKTNADDVTLPEVVCFNKQTKTLMLSEICSGGRSLEDDLKAGVFDVPIAKQLARFLARCHSCSDVVVPYWGGADGDLAHWRIMLALRTTGINTTNIFTTVHQGLKALENASDRARQNCHLHLDLSPKNILVNEQGLGVIDHESSSSVGDPACDFGYFMGHYLLWGIYASSTDDHQHALRAMIDTYRHAVGDLWFSMRSRVAAFAGAAILHAMIDGKQTDLGGFESQLIALAVALLNNGLGQPGDVMQIMNAVASGEQIN